MMQIDGLKKCAAATLGSGVLVGLLFAAGCSDRKTTGNKLEDPQLKSYMQATTEQFKTKMQEMKNKPKTASSKRSGHS